jgi:UPF0716 protein FxsA
MFIRLLCIFTIIPLIELYILIKVGSHFGVLNTIAIVLGTGALGAYLAKQEGFKVWVMIQHELKQGRFPADEMLEGLLLLIAGVVLITPGILTDIIGLTLLIPYARQIVTSWIKRKLFEMVKKGNVNLTGFIN